MDRDDNFVIEKALLFTTRSTFAALVLLCYDITLTWADAIDYIWRTPRSLLKLVFITVRYFTIGALVVLIYFRPRIRHLLGMSVEKYCRGWVAYTIIALHIVVTAMEIILIMRVYALYNRSRRLLIVILAAFAVEQTSMIVSTILTVPGVQVTPYCFPTFTPDTALGFGFAPIIFETFLLALCAYAWLRGLRSGWGRVAIFRRFMRDGVWAFTAIFVVFAAGGVVLIIVKGPANTIMLPWQYTFSSICASRLTLYMHRRGATQYASSAREMGTSNPVPRAQDSGRTRQGVALTTFVHGVDDEQNTDAGSYDWMPPEPESPVDFLPL